jgi:vitamin B12 transporter
VLAGFAGLTGVAFNAGTAHAQQSADTVELGEIVITATRLPRPAGATGQSVTVISGDDLRARGVRRVVDALRSVPGVSVAQLGGMGAVASVFMRGGESDHVQVLIDGVQVNDPGGSYDWAHLTTDDVERIEIVRGPASVLYGSDAVAGVVQIFTRGGASRSVASKDGASHVVRAQVLAGRGTRVGLTEANTPATGAYGVFDWNATADGGLRIASGTRLTYAATASQLASDGAYAFNNQYDNTTLSGRIAIASLNGGDLAITARRVDQTFHYPTTGAGVVVDQNKYTDGTALSIGASAGYFLTQHLEARAQLASSRSRTGGANPADEPGDGFDESSADVRRNTGELRLNAYLPHEFTVTGGIEVERERGSTTFNSDGPFGPYNDASSAARTNTGMYAQLLAAPIDALDVTGGVRVDHNEQFGTFTTGRVAIAFRPVAALTLRTAYGTGFREPTFLEAYATGFAVGDPDLQPEHSRSAEVGADVRLHSAVLGATWFDQRFQDLIQYTFAAPAGSPNYYNVGRASSSGIELTGTVPAGSRSSISVEYTWLNTTVLDDGFGEDHAFIEGRPLLRRPEHQGSITAHVRPIDALTTTAALVYTGERDDLDFTDPSDFAGKRVTLPSHVTVDASASYRLSPQLFGSQLLLRVTNLFDRRYDEVYNFPAAGRVVWLGVAVASGANARGG